MEALEAACIALHAPPTSAEAQAKRSEAEAMLQHFKRSPNALNDAMSVISATRQPVVQFHCVATIREVTLTKWATLSLPEKTAQLDFLMQFLWQHYAEMPNYLSGAMLQAVVLLMKRGWLERAPTERDGILQQMGVLMTTSSTGSDASTGITTRLIATKWLLAFVTEFSSASKSSVMFQPVEFHTKSRKALEKRGLKQLVGFAIQLLEDLIRTTTMSSAQDGTVSKEQLELLQTAFMLCIELLNWSTTDEMGNLMWTLSSSTVGEERKAAIHPDESWRDILVRSELIHSAFNTYAFFRTLATKNEQLLHLARQFLIQLASLQGPIFKPKELQIPFLSEIFCGASAIIQSPFLEMIPKTDYAAYEIATREMIDICQLLFRLVSNLGLKTLVEASTQIFMPFLEELSSLSCKLLRSALEQIQQHLRTDPTEPIDQLWQLEGMDILLDAWVSLVNDSFLDSTPTTVEVQSASALLSQYSAPVIELYLQTQLELCAASALAEQDEDEDVEDNLSSGAREQIELAAALARANASSSAALLVNLIQSTSASIQQSLTGQQDMTPELSQLYEKLHFLVEVVGQFLADEYSSERPCIPSRIHATFIGNTSPDTSPIISLLLLVMSQLLELEVSRIAQNPTIGCISPFVSEQLFLTITRLCATYLAPDVINQEQDIAPALLQVFEFGVSGQAGKMVHFLVEKCTMYLIHWPTQPIVMQNLIQFLLVLSKTKAIGHVLHSSFWQTLVQANASAGTFLTAGSGSDPLQNAIARIPCTLRGQLAEALCRAGMSSEEDSVRIVHFEAVARPVEARLKNIIALPNLESKQTANDVRIQEELKLLIELYSGIARSAESYVAASVYLSRCTAILT